MLTPIQAILSALLTAVLVQFLTQRALNYSEHDNNLVIKDEIINLKQNEYENFQESVPDEVNKLLDAIFVTHGVGIEEGKIDEDEETEKGGEKGLETLEKDEITEEKIEIIDNNEIVKDNVPLFYQENVKEESIRNKKEILQLDPENFNSIYTGDWLILAHVPWQPSSSVYLQHFNHTFPSSISDGSLNFASLDCEAYPRLAALLNILSYPSLHLVTDSGRLREWPFAGINRLNQQLIQFLVQGQWKHLPVYQLLQSDDKHKNPNIFLNEIQIKFFNSVTSFMVNLKIFSI